MPKCADVQLQLGSGNLLQDTKDVAFFRKLQRLGSSTFGKTSTMPRSREGYQRLTPRPVHLPSWPDRWRHTSEGTGIQSLMFGSWWTPLPKLGERDSCLDKVLAFGAVFGSVQCGEEWDVSREAADETPSFTVWDLYHRMWNDIRAGVLAAKGQRFLLSAYIACNACFGPWNTHANFDTKMAWFGAWLSSSCASSQWFLENLQELAHDRGIPVPVGEASVKDFSSR